MEVVQNGKIAAELLQAQAHVWNHALNFINSMSLKCAIQLGIPDIIHNHGKPMKLSQLIVALPINKSKNHCIYRLMRILIHSGLFSQQNISESDPEKGYVITEASKLLLKDNPFSVTPLLLAIFDPILTKPWHHMSDWFQSADPTPFVTTHGMAFWDYAGHEPKLNQFFNDAMASDTRLLMSVVIEMYKGVFEGLESLVDVGGGTGTAAKAIAKAYLHLDCTVFDLPYVVSGLQGNEQNLKYVGGDMFQTIPSADTILLKWILHDWKDEECVEILKKCKDAFTTTSKVIIIEVIMENEKGDNDQSTETQLSFDLLMMVLTSRRERNEKEWANLIFTAGFRDYKISPILGLRSLIDIFP
ncbi:putative O-methyltransferase [Quillaja saponaria]|uniref:isoflavone 7-O-methyltransferase n=1 Tax=Quillaja saponaria TaxID=32244 RepID=A0AAD7LMI2_QUISA|nr:putative O-methyltransferase [Quillaja saponaria]